MKVVTITLGLSAVIGFGVSCGANPNVLRSGKETPGPTAEAKAPTLESDLADVRRADFTWLYVIRRRDGAVLSTEDKAVVRSATTQANRRVLSDEGKAIIVGSNYEESVPGIESLKQQFDVTDLSPVPVPGASPANNNKKAGV